MKDKADWLLVIDSVAGVQTLMLLCLLPSPPIDIICSVMIVWMIGGKIGYVSPEGGGGDLF